MTADVPTMEMVRFRLAGSPTPQDVLDAAAELESFLKGRAGFLRRELLVPDDTAGEWVDLVLWQSADDAFAAAQELESSGKMTECGFFQMIDPNSIVMQHLPAHAMG